MTVSATVATAPLMAAAFDQFSPAALPANVLAAPAVAPAMWLGMLTGILGQVPLLPVEPINWLDSLCLAYIAQIAHWLAAPRLGAARPCTSARSGRSPPRTRRSWRHGAAAALARAADAVAIAGCRGPRSPFPPPWLLALCRRAGLAVRLHRSGEHSAGAT